MKKIILIITISIIIVLGIWLGLRWYGENQIKEAFDGSDIYKSENRVLIDSVKLINSAQTFYWFSYDNGTFGHTDDFISLQQKVGAVNKDNAFFSSGYISSVSILNSDTILIKLTTKEYTFDSLKMKTPIKIELESEGIQVMPSKRKNISIK